MSNTKEKYLEPNFTLPQFKLSRNSENIYQEIDDNGYERLSHPHFENYSDLKKNKIKNKITDNFDELNQSKINNNQQGNQHDKPTATSSNSNNKQNKFISFFTSLKTNKKKMSIFLTILFIIVLGLILVIVLIVLGVATSIFTSSKSGPGSNPTNYSYNLGASYIGCYADLGNSTRDLDGIVGYGDYDTNDFGGMTIELCIKFCCGFSYAGVQFGEECFCGNSYGKFGLADNVTTRCNIICNGNSNEICGGANANSIYQTSLLCPDNGQNLDNNLLQGWYTVSGINYLTTQDKIDLSFKKISSISLNTFSGLSNVSQLFLNNNKLKYIYVNTFFGLSSLCQLYLYNNQIISISSNAFFGLSNLYLLNLAYNPLNSLNNSLVFNGLNALSYLEVQNCSINLIDQNVIAFLANNNDIYIYLYGNPILEYGASYLQNSLCKNQYNNCVVNTTAPFFTRKLG